jgi:hypothetical protein
MHVKTDEYYKIKIANIERAIAGTKHALRCASEQCDSRGVEAQASYLDSIEKDLAFTREEYAIWQNLPITCAVCDARRVICHSNTSRGSKTCLRNRRMI